jgi:hypothetical protein
MSVSHCRAILAPIVCTILGPYRDQFKQFSAASVRHADAFFGVVIRVVTLAMIWPSIRSASSKTRLKEDASRADSRANPYPDMARKQLNQFVGPSTIYFPARHTFQRLGSLRRLKSWPMNSSPLSKMNVCPLFKLDNVCCSVRIMA